MTVRKLDFSGVNSNGQLIPEGEYIVRLDSIDERTGENKYNSGNEGIDFRFSVASGEHEGAQLIHRQVLLDNQLWKYAELLSAFGHNVYGQAVEVDPETLVGEVVGVYVKDGKPFRGKVRSEIQTFAPADAVTPGDVPVFEDDEEEADLDLADLDA